MPRVVKIILCGYLAIIVHVNLTSNYTVKMLNINFIIFLLDFLDLDSPDRDLIALKILLSHKLKAISIPVTKLDYCRWVYEVECFTQLLLKYLRLGWQLKYYGQLITDILTN